MLVKIHKRNDRTIVAVCDENLIGQKFEESGKQLDLTGDFYNGDARSAIEAGDLIRNAYGINIVGEKSVKLAIDEGIIVEDVVKNISNIPYYQGTIDIS